MKKLFLHSTILLVSALSVFSCSKTSNTVNDGQIIETPYSMYFSDSAGVLYNTNDGKNAKVVFTSDGLPSRALITMGDNILWVKGHDVPLPGPTMYYSSNNGVNFNHAYDSILSYLMITVKGKTINFNQSMVAYIPSWDAGYIISDDPRGGSNIFGLAGNPKRGLPGYWYPENYYDTDQITNPHNISVTSLTVLKETYLMAYDGIHNRTFVRKQLQTRWQEVFGVTTLPAASATTFYSIGHINNTLIAIDNLGGTGAYHSDDLGANWYAYSGLPANTPLQCVAAPFEQVCLIGTDGAGVYLLNPNTNAFEARNNGLPANASVRGITFKENIFKNGIHAQYVYATTDQGLYQSSDMGNNWVRTIPGNLISIY